jgi:hypothetical protein
MRFRGRVWVGALLLLALALPAKAREIWEGRPPHGRDLMTRSERKQFWHEFLALETDAERERYWLEHIRKMDRRALEWGVELEPANLDGPSNRPLGPWRPAYFQDIMTDEEKRAYRSDLNAIPDREDRRTYVRNHILRMQLRAAKRGISIPSARRFDDVFDGITADAAGEALIGFYIRRIRAADAADLVALEDDSLVDSGEAYPTGAADDSLEGSGEESMRSADDDSVAGSGEEPLAGAFGAATGE